ncbi:hypothetical protein [Streptomyces justiciae]|uniref:Uncharacterized protein n=1 Tax=Streptomyces justiciae TaxID=2780140 RepID=A0ABU3M4N4_9ACTN|nr:hypothetical protein [Streptomyces justiciae]MDT7846452.1 hypothetical protein [Streptomyces justiciae]
MSGGGQTRGGHDRVEEIGRGATAKPGGGQMRGGHDRVEEAGRGDARELTLDSADG